MDGQPERTVPRDDGANDAYRFADKHAEARSWRCRGLLLPYMAVPQVGVVGQQVGVEVAGGAGKRVQHPGFAGPSLSHPPPPASRASRTFPTDTAPLPL